MCSVDAYKLFRDLRWRVHLCCVPKYLQMSIMCLSPFCCLLYSVFIGLILFQFSAWSNNAINPVSILLASGNIYAGQRSMFEQWTTICNTHLYVWSTLRGRGRLWGGELLRGFRPCACVKTIPLHLKQQCKRK